MNDIISIIHQALSFHFIQRAILAGILIALACSCLGLFLVLRRFSLIGDGLAHVSFAAIALALFLHQAPMVFAIPCVALASLLILELAERSNVYGDTALGLVSSFAVALGVLLASIGKGFNVDLFGYLFGNILAVSRQELWSAGAICAIVILAVGCFYHELFSITFDEEYAKASGVKVARINRALVVLTAVTIVLGVKLVGTMLVSGLIILPAATALQLVRGFKMALVVGAVIAVVSVISGILGAYVFDLPAGATIILVNFTFFILAFLASRWR